MVKVKKPEKKNTQVTLVVKRRGHSEPFDEKKTYGSVYAACSNCDLHEKECEKLAEQVLDELKKALAGKKEINSTEIFGLVISILAKYHEDAAMMYELHRDIS
ncbi:hypothetical protein J4450_01425 [Candidatus Micrarchaeota archaeon]|nr:hypothetical protein [Candidatus Micrarchaeota archaeon]